MISIKNIYWMLAYAYRSLNEKDINKMNSEEFENIYDLFCIMMTQEVNKQIKRGLNRDYIQIEEELSNLKGKINISDSVKKNTQIKLKMICNYDEYSINSYLNQIIKTACSYIIKSKKVSDKENIRKLRNSLLYLYDVEELDIYSIKWSNIRYTKNNSSYKMLINISYLILDGLLINKKDGKIEFRNYIDDQKMHKLYEKFILEYFKYHHPELSPSVPQIKWNVDNDFVDLLPKMQTDIVLYNKIRGTKLIIDAKYYSTIYQNNLLFDKNTYKSNNLYQIYTYVKNDDKEHTNKVSGMLLYAKTDKNDEAWSEYFMDGNKIIVSNLDMDDSFNKVKETLENIASIV